VVAALRQLHLLDLDVKVRLRDRGWSDHGHVRRFFGRVLRVLTPTTTMPIGVVTLLGASLWVPSAC
jgi:hypothetical protein